MTAKTEKLGESRGEIIARKIMTQFTARIRSIESYGVYEEKARQAVDLFVKVFNTVDFRNRVFHHKWKGKEQFANSDGQTNQQIYDRIMGGSELAYEAVDHEADVHLEGYGKGLLGSTIGKTIAEESLIKTRWKFIKNSTVEELAGHYAHEYCHCLGFDHDFNETASRPFSVPYVVGDIVAELA